ncbi:hypothetical protein D3C73_1241770 [compost metagenome]
MGRKPQTADIIDNGHPVEMLGRDVDADIKRRAWREQLQVFHHGAHQVTGQSDDQAMLFRQRDKHVGGNPALSFVFPAQQHFNPDTAAGFSIDDGLTVNTEFAAGNGMTNVVRQAHAISGEQIHHIGRQQTDQQRQRDMARQRRQRQHAGLRAEQ